MGMCVLCVTALFVFIRRRTLELANVITVASSISPERLARVPLLRGNGQGVARNS